MPRPHKDVPDPVDAHVARRLRERRRRAGLSQAALARRLGITTQQVQKFEYGKNRISAARLHALAAALDITVDAFFAGLPEDARALRPCEEAAVVPAQESARALALAAVFARIPDRGVRATLITLANKLTQMEAKT